MATYYLRPSADVSLQHTCSTGSAGYALINEATPDDDSKYIYNEETPTKSGTSTITKTSTFTASGTIPSSKTITSVKFCIRAKRGGGSYTDSTIAGSVGSSSLSATNLSTSYSNYEATATASDLSRSGNTATATLGMTSVLKVYKNDTANIRITQAFIQVEALERYSCSASSEGSGISNARVSDTAPWEGDTITFSCTVASGAIFDGWYNGSTRVSTSPTYTCAAANLNLVAKQVRYSCSASIGTGSTWITSATVSNTAPWSGESVTFTCVTNPEDAFMRGGWYNGSTKVTGDKVYTVIPTSNLNLTANIPECTFSATSAAASLLTATATSSHEQTGTTFAGDTISFAATLVDEDNTIFDAWKLGNVVIAKNNSYKVQINENLDLIAYPLQYACTATAGTGITSVAVDKPTPYSGEVVTFTCVVEPGKTFGGWFDSEDNCISEDQTFIIAAQNLDLTAKCLRYSCKATASTGIASVSVSESYPYEGDSVTFSCNLESGATFYGWLDKNNGDAIVSTSQSYTTAVSNELNLVADCKQMAIKRNDTWTHPRMYQKQNGQWEPVYGVPTGWSASTAISLESYNWSFNHELKTDGTTYEIISKTGGIISDFIPVTPGVALTIQGQGSVEDNTLCFTCASDKTYNGYFRADGDDITEAELRKVNKKVISAEDMTNIYYVQINAQKLTYRFIKVWQNDVLIFNGANCPFDSIQKVLLPYLSQSSYRHNYGQEITPTWYNYEPELINMTGKLATRTPGRYLVKLSLKDPVHYQWQDGTNKSIRTSWVVDDYLNFTALENSFIKFTRVARSGEITVIDNWPTLYYSCDRKQTWHMYEYETAIPLPAGKVIYWKSNDNYFSISDNYWIICEMGNGKIEANGDLNSIINFNGVVPDACYYRIFQYCTALTKAPTLPALRVEIYGYRSLFNACGSDFKLPSTLPAIKIGSYSYNQLYSNHSARKFVPEIAVPYFGAKDLNNMTYYATQLKIYSARDALDHPYKWSIPQNNPDLASSAQGTPFLRTIGDCQEVTNFPITVYTQYPPISVESVRVATPNCSLSSYLYTGSKISPEFIYDKNTVKVEGSFVGVGKGAYPVTFSLINPMQNTWEDGTTTPKETTWSISDYLNFTAKGAATTVRIEQTGTLPTVQYSFDRNTWTDYTYGTDITLAENATIYWKGSSNYFGSSETDTGNFVFGTSGTIEANGDVCSLINFNSTVPEYCFYHLLNNVTNLTKAPELPALHVGRHSYRSILSRTSSLVVPPALPAIKLGSGAYYHMFGFCTSLQYVPELSACVTYLMDSYIYMFRGCSALQVYSASGEGHTYKWDIPTYQHSGLTSLATNMFLDTTGDFSTTETVYFPQELYTQNKPITARCTALCFTANTDNCIIELTKVGSPNVSDTAYSFDGINWTAFTPGAVGTHTISLSLGDKIYFKNNINGNLSSENYLQFVSDVAGTRLSASGNIMSMYSVNNWDNITTITHTHAFYKLFMGMQKMLTMPELPATTLSNNCYENMFFACHSLNATTPLPATNLAYQCYYGMFQDCITLRSMPELPATTLAEWCYYNMFINCQQLIVPPKLPATTLATGCYSGMFAHCARLVNAPALPATTLANYCYSNMFYKCPELTNPPDLPAAIVPEDGYTGMFVDCTALTKIPRLPATILSDGAYGSMFQGCTSLATVTDLPVTKLATNCYTNMFNGCTTLQVADDPTETASNAWRIPTADVFENTLAQPDMFITCAGSRSSDTMPGEIGKAYTYYTQNVVEGSTDIPLCFMANQDDCTIELIKVGNPNIADTAYSFDNIRWVSFEPSETVGTNTIILPDIGKKIYFRNTVNGTLSETDCVQFVISGKTSADGNIMSMYNATNWPGLTTLTHEGAFLRLFYNCSDLTTAPVLPATTLSKNCYYDLFNNCSSLTAAPKLPATTLAEGCYWGMFIYCSAIKQAPKLPAIALSKNCYSYMFQSCTSLIAAPELPAPTIEEGCYLWMFWGCTALQTASQLPAIILKKDCYQYMFSNCTSLTVPPRLSATTLAEGCYLGMFFSCTSLQSVPALVAETLATNCYNAMFARCSSLQISDTQTEVAQYAWRIPAQNTFTNTSVQTEMFWSCAGSRSLDYMPGEAGHAYTYYTQAAPISPPCSALCYTATAANSTVELVKVGSPSISDTAYSYDGLYWTTFTPAETTGTNIITLTNIGDKVYFKNNITANFTADNYLQFSITGASNTSGNIMSLYTATSWDSCNTLVYEYAFYKLFKNCINLTFSLKLPATSLSEYCYAYMFDGCTGLIAAPTLSALTLANCCYNGMFANCTSLINAPALPATTLIRYCYYDMFNGCTSLVTPPALPATTLVPGCYSCMFMGCSALATAPVLSAMTLEESCYNSMFRDCVSLRNAPELPATTMYSHCYNSMFRGCTNLTACPQLPATILSNSCYMAMFKNCENITSTPKLSATTLYTGCYADMFSDCIRLTTVPALPATTLVSSGYLRMFNGCSALQVSDTQTAAAPQAWRIPTANTITSSVTQYNMFSGCAGSRSTENLPGVAGNAYTYYTQNTPIS